MRGKEYRKMDEDLDLEKRAIEALPVVSSVRFHAGDKTDKAGYHANLRCGCGAAGGAHPHVKQISYAA